MFFDPSSSGICNGIVRSEGSAAAPALNEVSLASDPSPFAHSNASLWMTVYFFKPSSSNRET
jgi:hypothetical protein